MAKRPNGFTLLELLASTAVVALLACVAIPALNHAVAGVRTGAAKAALEATLLRSVSRAGIAGSPVVLCPGRAGTCADSVDWSTGWIAFHDLDGSRTRTAGEPLVAQQPALPSRTQLISTEGRRLVVFQPGGGNAGSNVTFTFCDARGRGRAVSLILSNAGRLREAPASPSNAEACELRLASRT